MSPTTAAPVPARLTGSQARRFLSPHMSASKFYALVRELHVPRHEFGPRCVEFDLSVMEELRAFFAVRTPADAKRVADGRHKFSWTHGGH